ncbi:respiratory nitrate reductase 2 gamma chain [Escherichia coli]|nr:respiratory nitrate reductase 2 gamma chain [Escherichia coli]VTM63760.1 respiratory nitrate reductase 2 gamma chain [Escherichia coli]
MIQYLNVFFYDIYPYICATVFFLGSWLRYDYGQYTWRASSSQMLDKRGMVIWSNLFHIGILGIFFGHLFGMLTPHWMYAWFLPVAAKTTHGDGARRYLRCVDVDWRRRTAVAQADKSARACHFHYAGYHHHEHFADPVSVGAKYHTVFSTVS